MRSRRSVVLTAAGASACVLGLGLAAACSDDSSPEEADRSTTAVSSPDTQVQESEGLRYGLSGADVVTPFYDTELGHTTTVGMTVYNSGGGDVTITNIEPAETLGMDMVPSLLIGPGRAVGQLASDYAFPPGNPGWAPEDEAAYEVPFDLLPDGTEGTRVDGVLVLWATTLNEVFSYVKGIWVSGTEDGRQFTDFVDVYAVYCLDAPDGEAGDDLFTPECEAFVEEHSFSS